MKGRRKDETEKRGEEKKGGGAGMIEKDKKRAYTGGLSTT